MIIYKNIYYKPGQIIKYNNEVYIIDRLEFVHEIYSEPWADEECICTSPWFIDYKITKLGTEHTFYLKIVQEDVCLSEDFTLEELNFILRYKQLEEIKNQTHLLLAIKERL